jgi:hypothetical protein
MPNELDKLIKQLNDSVENFNSSLNVIQADVLAEVELLLKDISLSGSNITQSVSNLRRINTLKDRIDKVVISPEYKQRVIDFGKAFSTVEDTLDSYFSTLIEEYSAPEILAEIKKLAIQEVVEGLTESGIRANVSDRIGAMLQDNIEAGSKYTDMVKELKAFIVGDSETLGAMERYAGTITTDSINQYAATYNKIITDDLDMDWSVYVGALVGGSRDLCEHLIAKKYIHKSELPGIVKGKIDGVQIPINRKTGLPYGMIPGTTVNNFQVRRGGYKCNHLLLATSEERVPIEIRKRIEQTLTVAA